LSVNTSDSGIICSTGAESQALSALAVRTAAKKIILDRFAQQSSEQTHESIARPFLSRNVGMRRPRPRLNVLADRRHQSCPWLKRELMTHNPYLVVTPFKGISFLPAPSRARSVVWTGSAPKGIRDILALRDQADEEAQHSVSERALLGFSNPCIRTDEVILVHVLGSASIVVITPRLRRRVSFELSALF
jgi:hypothetical protein